MQQHGILTKWDDEKGFGFITPEPPGPRVFVHISSFPNGHRRPVVDEPLTFTVGRGHQQRPRAKKVAFGNSVKRDRGHRWGVPLALGVSVGFFALLWGFVNAGFVPRLIVGFYALASCVSFFMYALDKRAARRGAWRRPEATLHLTEIAGGWPGALLAQHVFRHKTKKQPFQVVFWCAVIVNCAALAWLLYAENAAGLRSVLDITRVHL